MNLLGRSTRSDDGDASDGNAESLPTLSDTKLRTGIGGLDQMLGGGIPSSSTLIVAGAPGAGKTTLAQQIAYSLAGSGKRTLYLNTLTQPLVKLVRDLQGFSFFEPAHFNIGVKYHDLSDGLRGAQMSDLGMVLSGLVAKYEPALLVIDSIRPALEGMDNPAMLRRFIYSLSNLSIEAGAVVMMLGEYLESELMGLPEAAVADGIISMTCPFQSEQGQRTIRILKMRGAEHIASRWEFRIGRDGLHVFPDSSVVYSNVA